jgi:hypothetical protein
MKRIEKEEPVQANEILYYEKPVRIKSKNLQVTLFVNLIYFRTGTHKSY